MVAKSLSVSKLAIFCVLLWGSAALAQTGCPSTAIANGNPADATLVTSWFACKAPADNPVFTGNVGIGIGTPSAALTIESTASPGYQHGLLLSHTNSPTVGMDAWYDNSGDTFSYIESRYDSANAQMNLRMRANGTPVNALSIQGSGYVGFGTTAPIAKLSLDATSAPSFTKGLYIGLATPTVGMDAWYDNTGDTFSYIESRYDSANAQMNFRMRANGTPVNALSIKGTGYVGFGTTAPIAKLSLDATGTPSYTNGLYIGLATPTVGMDAWYDNTGDTFSYIESRYDSASAQMNFRMRANGTPVNAMTILGSGNIGIGMSSPAAPLDIYAGISGDGTVMNLNSYFSSLGFRFNTSKAYIGTGGFAVSNGTAASDLGLSAGASGKLLFGVGGGVEAMRIAASGKVGIGTTTPAEALEVAGQVRIDTLASGTMTGLCINGSVISSCSSSIRYKEDIRSASFGLRDVMAMRPVTFKWRGRNEKDFGLVAEEVAKVDPSFVTYKNGNVEGVKYPQLVAVLIGAIKQQQSQITQLKNANAEALSANGFQAERLHGQEKQVEKLQVRLAAVERQLAIRISQSIARNRSEK